ncbi:MAG: DNA repair protein RadC [bacterium]|nr:DNA repair protein RadC [bacterium]
MYSAALAKPLDRLTALGPLKLSAGELLAIILGSGKKAPSPKIDKLAESLTEYSAQSPDKIRSLLSESGISSGKTEALIAALELGKRASAPKECCITTPESAYCYFQDMIGLKKEHFRALYLDSKKHLIKSETISIGDLSSSIVHPREVFIPAIANSADSLIVAHNHPSGDPEPSPADLALTEKLAEAGKILSIKLVDHIIIGKGSFVSLNRSGYLRS